MPSILSTADTSRNLRSRHPTLVERVVDQILTDIVEGVIRPGEQLKEVALAEEYGVSRGTLREAVRTIQGQGLIEVIPSKGSFVRLLDSHELLEVYEMRAELDGLAIRLATERINSKSESDRGRTLADLKRLLASLRQSQGEPSTWRRLNDEFHLTLYRASERQRLLDSVSSLMALSAPYARRFVDEQSRLIAADREHEAILDLVIEGDAIGSETLTQDHLQAAADVITELMAEEEEERGHPAS